MGNSHFSRLTMPHVWKEDEPDAYQPLKYHPQFGFEDRPKEVIKATKEEMDSAGLSPNLRDACAHYRILYNGCLSEKILFYYKCNGYYDEMIHCYTIGAVSDMMEYEREKRLNKRERRIRASQSEA